MSRDNNLDLQSFLAADQILKQAPGLKRAECEKLVGKYLQTLGRNGLTAVFVVLRADGPQPPDRKGNVKQAEPRHLLAENVAAGACLLLEKFGLLTPVEPETTAAPDDDVAKRNALVENSRARLHRVAAIGETLESLLLAKSLLEGMLTYLRYAGKALPKD